jgi:hypothetical protein
MEHGLGGEQQRGDGADAQPPVREGNARGREQSRSEQERPGRWDPSAGQGVRNCRDDQTCGGQCQATLDPAASTTELDLKPPHGPSLGIRVGHRKSGGYWTLATVPAMATWDDVRRIALGLPQTSEEPLHDGLAAWRINKKLFVWERPLRRADHEALGDDAPRGPILGARVADVGVQEALLTEQPDVYFTTPHFDGYPAVLVRLDRITVEELEELIIEAWLDRASKRLGTEYLATHDHERP